MGDHPRVSGRWGLERCLPPGLGHSKQLLLNKFFDPSTPCMRKGCDGGEKKRWEKTDENIGHYVIVSSRPADRQPLGRRTLVPIG